MQILGLLGMYFDAVVVEVEMCYFFSGWLRPYCGVVDKYLLRDNSSNFSSKFRF